MAPAGLDRTERFLRACRGEPVDRPPVWLMRQAGRYLPEYRRIREGMSFLGLCTDVEKAVEVSLQPLRLVGTEAVILFSDIFVPVPGMGVELDFRPGPVIAEPLRRREQVDALRVPEPRETVPYVFEILRRLRSALRDERVPLLGFSGAPFTLAAYLIEGRSSADFPITRRMLVAEPELMRALLAKLSELVVRYLEAQVEAGAQAVQLFDTWAGLLSRDAYAEWVQPTHREIAAKLGSSPVPLILYVRNSAHVLDLTLDSGAPVISVDWRVELSEAARRAGLRVSLQGNLDPSLLFASREVIFERVRALAAAAAGARGFVLNLGHGCAPDTPVAGVRAFTDAARALAEAS